MKHPPGETELAWQQLGDELRAFVRRRVNDEHAADDLAQDVLARFAHQVATKGRPDHPAAWLLTTARHAIVDHYRAQRPTVEWDDSTMLASPSDEVDLARLHASFRAFVHALPAKYREAVLLTEYEGLTQQQLAERLGVPLSTAKSRVQRAKVRLAQALHACCTFELDRRGGIVDYRRRRPGDCPECE